MGEVRNVYENFDPETRKERAVNIRTDNGK
jgi:hypothetical protein